MHFIIAILFIVTVLLAFFEDRLKDTQKVIILAVYALFMVILASTKDIEHTADALQYEDMFLRNDFPLYELMTEPSFIYLSRLLLAVGGTITTLFFVYALITIPAKLKALYSLTPYIFTALIIYIPIYFEVHDMIQIRAAAAATFLLSSLKPLSEKKYLLAAVLMICATLFHYSAVAYLPFLFIGNRRLNVYGRVMIAVAIPVCFGLYMLKLNLFSLIPSFLVEGKLDYYSEAAQKGEWEELSAPYLNLFFLGKCAIIYLCLFYYDIVVNSNKYAPLIINLSSMGVCFLLSMASIPVIAGRVSDMYGIVDCILYTFLIYLVSPRYAARIAIVIAGLFMLVYNIVNTEYFT